LTLELVRNPDILAELAQREGKRLLVGFAAETERVLENAREKLASKGCDLMIANDVSRTDVGFDVDRNEVWILGPGHEDVEPVPAAAKREVAERILDRIRRIRDA
jgi:phosphopantothenoylcysteine decarboxylase/phosphopantothenate--cysteine ligase